LYGLTSQLRRACSSIPANLAEGWARNGDAQFARFCSIAIGSASELEYHLLLAKDLRLIDAKNHVALSEGTTELKRMLTSLRKKLKADSWQLDMNKAALVVLFALPLAADSGFPVYTAQSIANSAANAAGYYTPNSFLSIYRQNLAYATKPMSTDDIRGGASYPPC
jgi:four helix bundle protein